MPWASNPDLLRKVIVRLRREIAGAYVILVLAVVLGLWAFTSQAKQRSEDNAADIRRLCEVIDTVIGEASPVIPPFVLDGIDAKLEPICGKKP